MKKLWTVNFPDGQGLMNIKADTEEEAIQYAVKHMDNELGSWYSQTIELDEVWVYTQKCRV